MSEVEPVPAVPEPNPEPPPSIPWWRQIVSQYFVPTALATIIASALSIYTALTTAHEKQQEYNAKFETLVTDKAIFNAFGGYYLPEPGASAYQLKKDKASHDQSVLEQHATTTLLSLQSVAESETQRRTVLLIGARLLNADPTHPATGADAARLLEVLIDEADNGRSSWNPSEASLNSRLWRTIESDSFTDLVTAGYPNDYYNDYGGDETRPEWPTLNGDAPVSHDAKFQVLWRLTAPQYEGWVHVATYKYEFPRGSAPKPKPSASRSINPPVTPETARHLIEYMTDVNLRRNVANVGQVVAQYAIPDPRATPVINPLFTPPELVDPKQFPPNASPTWIMLRSRLLRDRPPVEFISPDGTFRKGTLGRIVGTVPAGSCISVVEPLLPVLVFLPSHVVAGQKPTKSDPLVGLVHFWVHIKATKDDENCLAVIARPQ
ncbi:MAG: hypothetical protein WB609_00760 [Candidatus Cybelea sp.]